MRARGLLCCVMLAFCGGGSCESIGEHSDERRGWEYERRDKQVFDVRELFDKDGDRIQEKREQGPLSR